MDILFESFLRSFLPLILLMPYLFLLYFFYGKLIENKKESFESKRQEANQGFKIIEKIAFIAYCIILLQAIFDGKILTIFFIETLFIDKLIQPKTFWLNFLYYSSYVLIIFFRTLYFKKK